MTITLARILNDKSRFWVEIQPSFFDMRVTVYPAAVSYFSGMELCSGRIGCLRERTGLGTGFIRLRDYW